MLGESSDSVIELAYQYGKNTGIAFQVSSVELFIRISDTLKMLC